MASGKAPPKRSRFHSVITYATESQLQDVIIAHQSSIRAWAYIYHDKDESEPHYHIVIRTFDSWYNTAIERWFKGLKDKQGNYINTFCEKANDLVALEQYLTHDDFESRQQGKYRYSKSQIHDFGLWDIVPCKDSYDDSYDVVNDIINGMSCKDLLRRYGRDYLFHRWAYQDIADSIIMQEGYYKAYREAKDRRSRPFEVSNLDQWDKDL